MKLKTIISSAIALTVGLSGAAFAVDYLPPALVHCTLSAAHKLSCTGHNTKYLTESTHTVDMEVGKDIVLNFNSGAAFTASPTEWAVFYNYKSADGKDIKLRTVNNSLKPNLVSGAWGAVKNFYTCSTAPANCPIIVS